MKIQWALMAEGITVDARGALTAVGLAQSVLVAPILPIVTKRAVISEFLPGNLVKFVVEITGPSGEVLSKHQGNVPMASSIFHDVPAGITLSAEMALMVKEYGRHLIKIETEPSGHPRMNAELEFFVKQPPDNG